MLTVRPAAVAGLFYPGAPPALKASVRALLDAAPRPAGNDAECPKALIVPHAGYIYSGPIAASAYARLVPGRSLIRRVVLLGPVHRVPIRGLALPAADSFVPPLRDLPVDAAGGWGGGWGGRGAPASDPSGGRERASSLARAFTRGAATFPADDTRRIHPGSTRGRGRVAIGSRGSDRAPVGRARDADRGQLGLVALPSVRAGCRDR